MMMKKLRMMELRFMISKYSFGEVISLHSPMSQLGDKTL